MIMFKVCRVNVIIKCYYITPPKSSSVIWRQLDLNKIVIWVFNVKLLCEWNANKNWWVVRRKEQKIGRQSDEPEMKLNIKNLFFLLASLWSFFLLVSAICIKATTRAANYRMIVKFVSREIKKKPQKLQAKILSISSPEN